MADIAGSVLVIDDELGIREGCRRALVPQGFEVETAENGPLGLHKLREAHFDVLLIDAMMPGMSGMEVLRQVQQLDPEIICIIITGYATVELAVQAVREGADDFIAKPFSSEHLLQVINRELERRRLRREAARVKELEEETHELARARAELQKMEAVQSRFMLTMVHTLRAPVAVLQNSVQLIQKGYAPPEKQTEILERAEQRAGELLTILDDLLVLGYLKEGVGLAKLEAVSVRDVLEDVLEKYKTQAKQRGIEIVSDEIAAGYVAAQADHIKSLWMQLLSNAVRYTPAEGEVIVSLHVNDERKVVVGTVKDTGIGMETEEISRIFEEFYRTERAKKMQEMGTGLGLSIVQQIMKIYRGTIEVESTVNAGSTFRFTLPLADRAGE